MQAVLEQAHRPPGLTGMPGLTVGLFRLLARPIMPPGVWSPPGTMEVEVGDDYT
jgi:hypothetical protein